MENKFMFGIGVVKTQTNANESNNVTKETPAKYGYNTSDLNRICVYTHTYENESEPFYVGQGRLSRAFNFLNRDKAWKNKVIDQNKVKVDIIAIDISIEESINMEKELIAKYGRLDKGTGSLVNGNDGDIAIGAQGEQNYFYNKHLYGKDNGNFGNKYNSNPLSIPVVQIDILGNVIKHWDSATQADEVGGFIASCISNCCLKRRKLHKGFQWIFESEFKDSNDYTYIPGKTSPRIYLCLNLYGDYIKTYYNNDELISDGFNPKNVSQVCNGDKKSHKNYVFLDFFKLSKEDKQKCIDNNIIEIRD